MRAALYGLLAVAVAGCGYPEDKFLTEFTEAECAYTLQCYPESWLTLNQWTDEAACVADLGPEHTREWGGCVYDKAAARECVKKLEELDCAPDGERLTYPAVCGGVFGCMDTGSGHDIDTGPSDDTDR